MTEGDTPGSLAERTPTTGARVFPDLDFDHFHEVELPRRLAGGHARAAAPGLADAHPLGLRIAGTDRVWTYVPRPGATPSILLERGDTSAATVVTLSLHAWSGLVHDVESPPSLLYHGEVDDVRGDGMGFVRWEALLRAMYTGRPVYDAARVDLRDRRGAPLDPAQGFASDDDPAEMAHFLREAGYLLVKQVFSRDEVARFRAAADALHAAARPGDQQSWWGRNRAGDAVLCRVLSAAVQPALRGLERDPRILRLVALADQKLVPKAGLDERDRVTVLWKNPGVSEGLSDLPWHRDCGMGGHASMCPTIVGSVFLEANTPETGALRFLPGSWRASYRFADASAPDAQIGVLVPAEPGDLTIHYGDGWHAAPPPTREQGPHRCCVLVSYEREGAFNHRGERHYNDVLLGAEDGQVKHMARVARETGADVQRTPRDTEAS